MMATMATDAAGTPAAKPSQNASLVVIHRVHHVRAFEIIQNGLHEAHHVADSIADQPQAEASQSELSCHCNRPPCVPPECADAASTYASLASPCDDAGPAC
ncbi:MAG: hypothetical protein EBY66_03895 [Candidatus Fonsibacter lacus]|nr:hypothetical protein [Candidatus Fonsibacter lacus]